MKNYIQKIANHFGYRVVKNNFNKEKSSLAHNKNDLLHTFYSNLIALDFFPNFVIDIGANTGTWTRELLKFFPNSKILMIEPQENLMIYFQDLLGEQVSYLPLGASNKNDLLKFTLHDRDDSCSFTYSEEEAKKRGFKQIEIPVKTLNSIIADNNLPCPDLIKIDAEGLDLEVIEGASDFYGKTEIFIVEATVCNNSYQNTVAKITKKMDECGYQMYEITDLNRPFPENPILWLIEIAFVKKNGYLLNRLSESI